MGLDKTLIYCYDNIGNVSEVKEYDYTLSDTPAGECETTSYSYNQTHKDRLISYDGEEITYDSYGYPNSYQGKIWQWENGKLKKMYRGSDTQYGSVYEESSFRYDAYGRRTRKYYSYDPAVGVSGDGNYHCVTTYDYDHSGRLIHELCKDVRFNDSEITTHDLTYLYDETGIIGVNYSHNGATAIPYYYRKNLQGDVTAMYRSDGTIIAEYRYDAYGNCTISPKADYEIAIYNPIRYRSYYYDKETKLYYLNARYYNPLWRRFISPDDTAYLDPETPNGLNLYAYCCNDPVNYADPSGHLAFFIVTAIIGAALGLGITAAVDYIPDQEFNLHWGWYVGAGLLGAAIGAGVGMAVSYYATGSIASSTGKVMSGLFGKTSFYRTMSADDYASLKSTGKMPHTKETFISPDAAYASKYNGVTVKFTVRNRTVNWLTKIGVRDTSALVSSTYPSMSVVSKGWTVANAFFKAECGIINIGLGAGTAWEIFNKGILYFGLI